jgi:membrane associated rhomboid family serine protease
MYTTRRSYPGSDLEPIWLLMLINLVVFVAVHIDMSFNNHPFLTRLFAMTVLDPPVSVLYERPWSLITSMFTHVDFMHILFNMLSLYFLGSFLLKIIGTRKFFLVYFLGGIVGNIFFLFLASTGYSGIGASGAIFALGGTLAMLAPKVRVYIIPFPVPMPLWVAIMLNFLLVFVMANIAWQAHLGGLVFGLLVGYFWRNQTRTIY